MKKESENGVGYKNGFEVSLRCWTCGKIVPIITSGPPQFAFEVAGWAKQIGWIGAIDMRHHRSLVFCSEVCCDEAKTKAGEFRLYPAKKSTSIRLRRRKSVLD